MTLLPPPAVPVFPAGYGPLPSDFDTWVQDSLGFCTTGIVFRAQQENAQSFGGSGFYVISYDTILEDPYSGWIGGGINSWVAPYTGWYEISLGHSISNNAVVTESVILVSNNLQYEFSELTAVSSTFGGTGASIVVSMIGGLDFIQGQAWVSGASDTDTSAPGRYPWMEITFVSQ